MQINGISSTIPAAVTLNQQSSKQSSARPEAGESAAVEAAESQATQGQEGEAPQKPTTSRLDIYV
jgi:hypothetical protein